MTRGVALLCGLCGVLVPATVSGGHVERIEAVVDAGGDAIALPPDADSQDAGGELRSFIRREVKGKRRGGHHFEDVEERGEQDSHVHHDHHQSHHGEARVASSVNEEEDFLFQDPGEDEDGEEPVHEQNASLVDAESSEEETLLQKRKFDALNVNVNTAVSGNVPMINGWRHYGGGWSPVTYALRGGVCYLHGLARGYRWNRIAQLPSNCRPRKRLIFSCNNHENSARCDVASNGVVSWHAGGHRHRWLSLSGIKFVTAAVAETPMQMVNTWRAYGGGWGTPSFSVNKGYCVLSGLGRTSNQWGVIGYLPQDCWPQKRLVFQVNNHQYTSRIDVHYNGEVSWQAGGKSHNWLSLSGVSFPVSSGGQGSVLYHPSYKWHDFDHGNVHAMWNWGGVTYNAYNGVCMLEGLASQGATSQKSVSYRGRTIARLPKECRPKRRYIYSGSRHDFTSRIDVTPSGHIVFISNTQKHNWVSLSGMAFMIDIPNYKGANGDVGPQGVQGAHGEKGPKGALGERGVRGDQGVAGIHGVNGLDGRNASDGEQGDHGILGRDGDLGEMGKEGDVGDNGADGLQGKMAPQPVAVDCVWLDWFSWNDCSATCDKGTSSRHRQMKTEPSNGGADCDGGHVEQRECMEKECGESGAGDGDAAQEEAPNMGHPEGDSELLQREKAAKASAYRMGEASLFGVAGTLVVALGLTSA